jgi:hypothetical protein
VQTERDLYGFRSGWSCLIQQYHHPRRATWLTGALFDISVQSVHPPSGLRDLSAARTEYLPPSAAPLFAWPSNHSSNIDWRVHRQSPAGLLSYSPLHYTHNPSKTLFLHTKPSSADFLHGCTLIRDQDCCLSKSTQVLFSSVSLVSLHHSGALASSDSWFEIGLKGPHCRDFGAYRERASTSRPQKSIFKPQVSRLPSNGLNPYLGSCYFGRLTPSIRRKAKVQPQPGLTSKVKRSGEGLGPRQSLL